jgi:VIT1/CCC1 family predicted Fe2+/Mn2+ transporter
MEKEQQIIKADTTKDNLQNGAKVALVILLFNVVGQLATVYQTRYQLVSPLIPESTIWEINKQFIFHAIVSAIASIVGLLLYFFHKYLLVIILVSLVLLADRFIYV